jgi:hypothetical protein
MNTKTKVHYELKLKKTGTIGCYKVGVKENKPYTVKMGETFIVKKLSEVFLNGVEVNLAFEKTVRIPYKWFEVTKVETKTVIIRTLVK